MNAVEIEQAISDLADQPFDPGEFPFAFLEAFGNKPTTIKKLRIGSTNKSDLGGILQIGNIHIKTTGSGLVSETLTALRESRATQNKRHQVKFILATDGKELEAEDLTSGETLACAYEDFPHHFGFFLRLAGITTVQQIRENAFDVRATSRLNRLYVTLLQDNIEWSTETRRHDMNHFMARLIFCFFAEDTGIFNNDNLFTTTVAQMSEGDGSNTNDVISKIFLAMNVPLKDRGTANLPRWASAFPYVNGELFSGVVEVPRFSRIAQKYLLHIGNLDWKQINPDIFGSMIQAVADEEERSVLGMHYTSVPNILKVLNPLFLDDLHAELNAAGDNPRKLLKLRNRISNIRVFDPACGSGNFLVIAYKKMRAIEAEINIRRGEANRSTDIPLTNFRGIELRDFSAEIARLALIIAEYQCDVLYVGQMLAKDTFLPLDTQNWITCGNALQLNWLSVCPPTGTVVNLESEDLFGLTASQSNIDFSNEGGETYICGNPPYLGSQDQSQRQKAELKQVFQKYTNSWKSLDYVSAWFVKASEYGNYTATESAFVATNSICQGRQAPILWQLLMESGQQIIFAHTSFKWSNLAKFNAGVTVIIVGISNQVKRTKRIYSIGEGGETTITKVNNIDAYLTPNRNVFVERRSSPLSDLPKMSFGNQAIDDENLILNYAEKCEIEHVSPNASQFIKPYSGGQQFIQGVTRWCIWVEPGNEVEANKSKFICYRAKRVRDFRDHRKRKNTKAQAKHPFQFGLRTHEECDLTVIVPRVTSEERQYLPCGVLSKGTIVADSAFAIYNAELWNLAIIGSRLHLVWIAEVCGKLETRHRYSNTLGWNTFPVPKLTGKNKFDLAASAQEILLIRERHFPAPIAELYKKDRMPDDLRVAHYRNDGILERIFIGRRFKNDTERLEKLFNMYSKVKNKF